MIQILTTDYGALISKDCGTNFIQHISFTNIQQTMIQILTTDYGALISKDYGTTLFDTFHSQTFNNFITTLFDTFHSQTFNKL